LSGQFIQQILFAAVDAMFCAIVTSHTHRNAMIQPKYGQITWRRRKVGYSRYFFCIFNHCYFIASPNKLKIRHTI